MEILELTHRELVLSMVPDIATTAAEHTEAAQRLVDEAQAAPFTDLVTLSALELCVLGGPGQALVDEAVAGVWQKLGKRRRASFAEQVTPGLIQRGLLTEDGTGPGGTALALSPALGIALAARSRPAWVVVTETAQANLRTPKAFALGDAGQPVRAVVLEEPAALPDGAFPNIRKLGLLGRFYRYVLLSQARAAEALADWAITPPPQPPDPGQADTRRIAISWHHDGSGAAGRRLEVRGDGATAQLLTPGPGDAASVYDQAGLTAVLADALTQPQP